MRKRFNKEQAPVHFNNYMSSLEDSRIRMGLGNEFEETNRGLCLGYFLTDDPENKIKLRNKLVMHNIKLAHEYLYKKLRVDISIENSIDIFQEINLCLVESVDKCLEVVEKRGSAGVFIPYLTYLLLNGLKKIANKYFDYNRLRKHLLNEDDLPMPSTVTVEEKIRREELMGLVRRYTDERESRVIEGYYFEETTLEELGYCFCLTRERTRQIREKGLKKIREGVEWYEEVRKNSRNNLNILKTCIANDPKIKFVVYDYCDLVIDNCVPLLKHNRTTLNGNIEYLLYKGIDLSEWLFIESGKNQDWLNSIKGLKWIRLNTGLDLISGAIYDKDLKYIGNEQEKELIQYPMKPVFKEMVKKVPELSIYAKQILGVDVVEKFFENDKKYQECKRRLNSKKHLLEHTIKRYHKAVKSEETRIWNELAYRAAVRDWYYKKKRG